MEKLKKIDVSSVVWKSIKGDGLNLEYTVPINKDIACEFFSQLENTLEYFTGDLSQIK